MAPKIELPPELRLPADIVSEDLALILDSMGVDPRIRELHDAMKGLGQPASQRQRSTPVVTRWSQQIRDGTKSGG